MKQTVLVLGAGGYVGGKLMAALTQCDDMQPIAGLRRKRAVAGQASLCLDATDPQALAQALRGVDVVVNCIGPAPDVMLKAAQALLQAAQDSQPLIVHFSSMAVYGASHGVIDENAPLRDELGGYASAKIEIERLMAAYPRRVILRPGCIYGPGSQAWSVRIARLLCERRLGDLGAAGDGIANLVHIDDVVAAVIAAIRQPRCVGETFNLAMSAPPVWNDYFLAFAKALGAVPIRRIGGLRLKAESKVFAPLLKICEILGRKLPVSFDPPPFISSGLLGLFRQDITLVSAKAEQELGLVWTDLEAALQDIAASDRPGK